MQVFARGVQGTKSLSSWSGVRALRGSGRFLRKVIFHLGPGNRGGEERAPGCVLQNISLVLGEDKNHGRGESTVD